MLSFFDELEMVGFSRCFAIFFPFGIRIDIDFFSIFIMSVVSSYIPGFCLSLPFFAIQFLDQSIIRGYDFYSIDFYYSWIGSRN